MNRDFYRTVKVVVGFMKLLAINWFLYLLFSGAVFGQQLITTNSRVKSYLNVRDLPGTSGRIVERLFPNQTAEFLDSDSGWYHIRLNTGQTGYVSQYWSDSLAGLVSSGDVLRLGSWNLKKLGHGNNKNYVLLADIIESNFDILALVEVMQKGKSFTGYDSLLHALGSGWSGLITSSPRPNTGGGYAEYYAVIYRPDRVRPLPGWNQLKYFQDNDGSVSGSGFNRFDREPAYAAFKAVRNSALKNIDFILGVYHARWADGKSDSIMSEVRNIENVFTEMQTQQPGEGDFFLLGDFNLVPDSLAAVTSAANRTIGTGSTLNTRGARTMNLYDYLLVWNEQASSELIDNATVLDVRHAVADSMLFYQTISDHLPIRIFLRIHGPDDD